MKLQNDFKSLDGGELCALVLTGGKSTRMGYDKAMIDYHGLPQAEYLLEILKALGLKSYLSCRQEQLVADGFHNFLSIPDRFLGFGPLGGILSAMVEFPGTSWLVIACDLPFISKEKIVDLISKRNLKKQATAYFNLERKNFEPLFAIYESHIYSHLLYFLGQGVYCPQKILFNSKVEELELMSQSFLENANTPIEENKIREILNGVLR